MRTNVAFPVLLILCALGMWSCSQASMPSSPSVLGTLTAPGTGGRLTTRDDPPAPAPAPAPDPNAPAPAPAPVAGTPTPASVLVSIISYFGQGSFNPNPITANVGDSIVFTNTDAREHHIVLDDGTDVGDMMPGTSSAPLTLASPTASFHCTIHPTMTGTINMPLPPDMSYSPPTPDYGYY